MEYVHELCFLVMEVWFDEMCSTSVFSYRSKLFYSLR
jgi:hypothetical protein